MALQIPKNKVVAWLHTGTAGFWFFLILAFGGSMFWAKSWDRFHRIWFTCKTANGKTEAVAVLPKPIQPRPVAIFLHDAGGKLLASGNILRQLAETQIATACIEYNQHDAKASLEQLKALSRYLSSQSWAKDQPVIWIGQGLGAERLSALAVAEPELQPDLLVQIARKTFPEIDEAKSKLQLKSRVLLVESRQVSDETRRIAELLEAHGVKVNVQTTEEDEQNLRESHSPFFRILGEFCQASFSPKTAIEILPEKPSRGVPFLVCVAPGFAWGLAWVLMRRTRGTRDLTPAVPLKKWEIGLRIVTVILVGLAVTRTAIQFVTPRMAVTDQTIQVARRFLLAPKWKGDFETLASRGCWNGQQMKTLLTHVELANYNVYELINWQVEKPVYDEYVLSPIIDEENDPELNWRRSLWEFFYPRIRKEDFPEAAAAIVVQNLRARISIDPRFTYSPGVESTWRNQITTPAGFERIYVATLRAVGVGARLNEQKVAEFWNGTQWQLTPRPLAGWL